MEEHTPYHHSLATAHSFLLPQQAKISLSLRGKRKHSEDHKTFQSPSSAGRIPKRRLHDGVHVERRPVVLARKKGEVPGDFSFHERTNGEARQTGRDTGAEALVVARYTGVMEEEVNERVQARALEDLDIASHFLVSAEVEGGEVRREEVREQVCDVFAQRDDKGEQVGHNGESSRKPEKKQTSKQTASEHDSSHRY